METASRIALTRALKVLTNLVMIGLLSISCQERSPSSSKQVESNPVRNMPLSQVPELFDSRILNWDFKDFDVLQKQFFYVADGEYYWLPKFVLAGVRRSTPNTKLIETSRAIQKKYIEASDILLKQIANADPELDMRLKQLEEEMSQLFASLGITDNVAPTTAEKMRKLRAMPWSNVELSFEARFPSHAQDLIQRYAAEFPFTFRKTQVSKLVARLNAEQNDFYSLDVTFDEKEQRGILNITFTNVMDGNTGPQLLPYSIEHHVSSPDGLLLSNAALGIFEGCFMLSSEYHVTVCE